MQIDVVFLLQACIIRGANLSPFGGSFHLDINHVDVLKKGEGGRV